MTPSLLALTLPSPPILIGAALLGAIVMLVAGADLKTLGTWGLVGGWFLFALSSPTAEFPVILRPLGLQLAFIGAVILRFGDPVLAKVEERVVPFPVKLLFVYLAFVFLGCVASPLGPKNVIRWAQGLILIMAVFYAVSLGLGRALLASTFFASLANVIFTIKSGTSEILANGEQTGRLSGYMQPNHLAFACAIVIIGAVWWGHAEPRYRFPLAIASLIAGYALFASESRTALMALIAALGAAGVATFIGFGRRGKFVAYSLVLVLVLAPLVLPAFGTWFNRDDSESSITSLTGRTDFWPLAVDLIEERPVIGWGVNVIGSPVGEPFQKVLPGVSQAHNAYLEAALQSGYPGAIAWGLSLIGVMIGSFKLKKDDPYRFVLICGAILTQIFAFTESGPAWFGDMFIVYVLTVAIYADQRVRQDRPAPEPELVDVRAA